MTTSTRMPHATLTLADIARLAGVQRPVVTMWAKRPLNGVPFPTPDASGRFALDDVTDYLTKTGRGNNRDAATESPLVTSLTHRADADRLVILQALIALRLAYGENMARAEDCADLEEFAESEDLDDEFLFTEFWRDPSYDLRLEAEGLIEASWSVAAAFDRVRDKEKALRGLDADRPGSVLVDFLASLVDALTDEPLRTVVDVEGTASDVAVHLLDAEDVSDPLVEVAGVPRDSRDLRRLYHVHRGTDGLGPRRLVTRDLNPDALRAQSLLMAVLPSSLPDAVALAQRVVAAIPEGGLALIVGPAAALTDEASDHLWRDAVVRRGSLRASVRLPSGLDRAGTRTHLALWLAGAEPTEQTLIADVSGHRFDAALRQRLTADVLASVQPRYGGHALDLLRPVKMLDLLKRSSITTPPVVLHEVIPLVADQAVALADAADRLTASVPGLPPITVEIADREARPRDVPLGELIRAGLLRALPGARLGALPTGSILLWTPDALNSGVRAGIDLATLAVDYPRAALTEPGDVVFCTVGRPVARVDALGGAAVAYPARILRSTSRDGLTPWLLAESVNARPAGDKRWRSWTIPVVRPTGTETGDYLRALADHEAALDERRRQLADLRALLLRSTAPGGVRLRLTDPTPKEEN